MFHVDIAYNSSIKEDLLLDSRKGKDKMTNHKVLLYKVNGELITVEHTNFQFAAMHARNLVACEDPCNSMYVGVELYSTIGNTCYQLAFWSHTGKWHVGSMISK